MRRQWSKERVVEAIQARQQKGLPLFGLYKIDRGLGHAARKHWGSWGQAVAAAGIPKGWKRHLDREQFLELLRRYAQPGVRLSSGRVPEAVFAASYRWFDHWRDALAAAGLAPLGPRPKAPRKWTSSEVLREIRARTLPGGVLKVVENRDLARAARKHFGSWPSAVLAAGLQPRPASRWTRQGVIDAIRARSRQGLPMTGVWKHDKRLYLAAGRCLGNWQNALAAAGFTAEPRRKWSRERVLEELRVWHRLSAVSLRTWDKRLANAIAKYFGSLRSALAAAGLESKPRKWSKQRVIEAIQDNYVRGFAAPRVGFGDVALAAAAQRRFGSWGNAWLAAGLPAEILKRRTSWTREDVLAGIRRWHERGRSLATVWRDFGALSAAAYRHFGSWPRALAAAGLSRTGEGQ